MLFVDLVGYTSLSESRDAEDVRELLGRYFEQAKTIIGRYGGTIAKFIGDAVMAVWGVPSAHEDDAERAVRAGLELVESVARFGDDVGAPALSARAGVVTGQVAALADPGEGLVVGDRVNTASRVQSAADPGTVLVDEITRQVTSAGIAYADAGEHTLKGKAQPMRLWRALRVVAGVAGSQRTTGLDAPFAGRDAELRLIKDLFHAAVDRGAARLVGISGSAGIGKTRLGVELSNYVDGLVDEVLWHSGRCLSFGEGVAYWALAEMVRQRLGIAEDTKAEEASARLTAGLEQWIADENERRLIDAALGALIGVAEPGLEREELFANWRLFFERLSEHDPVVLVFEDMQWADDGLLDFVEQLLDWSAAYPIFVCVLSRPELLERRAGWPSGLPCATAVALEPLDDDAMAALLAGLVAGIPTPALRRIVDQAEGVPLYAVETVRALADRRVLAERDGTLELVGEIGELDVPASLTSLLAARLDALSPDEREVVKAMAVFGGSFPRASAVALADVPAERLDDVLASLVDRAVLAIRTDRLSPDRGQYAFAQSMLRTVAYEMLAKRERRARHLAAAEHLREAFPNEGEDVSEVIAAHLLDAYRTTSDEGDTEELRGRALTALRVAAQRAATVGAPDTAERALRNAIELARSEAERTALTEEAARMAERAGRHDVALELFEGVAAAHSAAGRDRDAARLQASIGLALSRLYRTDEAIARMRPALDALGSDPLDPDAAALAAELGRSLLFAGRSPEAGPLIERAMGAAEALELPALACRAFTFRAYHLEMLGRYEEARALYDRAIAIGERHHLTNRVTAQVNGAYLRIKRDMPGAIELCEAAVATARQLGDRSAESIGLGNLMMAQLLAGRWREVERIGERMLEAGDGARPDLEDIHHQLGLLRVRRGDLSAARSHLAELEAWKDSDDVEVRHVQRALAGLIALGEGDLEPALGLLGETAREAIELESTSAHGARTVWPDAVEAALALERLDDAEELIALIADRPVGLVPPFLRAELSRTQALLAAARGEHGEVEAGLVAAIDALATLAYPFWLTRAKTDLAEWLTDRGRGDEAAPLYADAATTFQELGATTSLTRVRGALGPGDPPAVREDLNARALSPN